jgi:hypothetical protein
VTVYGDALNPMNAAIPGLNWDRPRSLGLGLSKSEIDRRDDLAERLALWRSDVWVDSSLRRGNFLVDNEEIPPRKNPQEKEGKNET